MNTAFRKISAFSLVELVTSMAIFGLIALMVGSIYLAHFRLFSNQNKIIDVSNENKIALDEITNQIRESKAVVATCPNCAPDDTTDLLNQPSSKIVLELWPLNQNGEPFEPAGSAFDYVVYKRDAVDNTKLVKKVIPDAASTRRQDEDVLIKEVDLLSFTFNSTIASQVSQVETTITTKGSTTNKTHTVTESTKTILRNK